MVGRGRAFYDEEIARADAILRQTGVTQRRFFRTPYGKKRSAPAGCAARTASTTSLRGAE
jgi:hypothetical protein